MNILLAIAISLLLLFNPGMNAYAAESQTATSDPPPCPYEEIDINNEDYAGFDFANPDEISFDGENPPAQDLNVQLTSPSDTKIAGCPVTLRSYNGELVGPTIRVHPGGTIHLNLKNNLILDPDHETLPDGGPQYDEHYPDCEYVEATTAENAPHNFNTTNFHTHGLHVDPDGCSDNVLRVMRPRLDATESAPEYEIIVHIPEDHTSGTFWYHAHLHGSTALQVSSAMAGALIVEPEVSNPSDIQTLDDIPAIAEAKPQEKIFVLQQISYDDEGKIEDYTNFGFDQSGNNVWIKNKRHTTINGQVVPVITMQPGEVQRWRFIHAGVRESINLEVRNQVTKTSIPLHEIAVDGIPLGKLDSWETSAIELEPGYRSDVLFQAPDIEGSYYLNDKATTAKESLNPSPLLNKDGKKQQQGEPGHVLAKVIVKGGSKKMDLPTNDQLAAAKTADAPRDINGNGLSVTQQVIFSVHQKNDPTCIDNNNVNNCPFEFTVNDEPFNPQQARTLHLDDVERWELSVDSNSVAASHPFHIHVNPFQYVRKGAHGEDETIWRDTLLVRQSDNPKKEIVTRYDEFTGKFVQHCHILDHEDQGMMEVVEIVGET